MQRGHDVAVLQRRDRHDLGLHVRNLQADRGDLGAIAQVLRQERPEVVFDIANDWGRGTPAVDVVAAARNSRRPADALRLHVEHRRGTVQG